MTDMNHTETEPEQSLNLPDGSSIPNELVDLLLKDYKSPEDLIGENGLLKQLTAALVNRALQAEISHHLGYQRGEKPPEGQANRRNGSSPKKLRSPLCQPGVRPADQPIYCRGRRSGSHEQTPTP